MTRFALGGCRGRLPIYRVWAVARSCIGETARAESIKSKFQLLIKFCKRGECVASHPWYRFLTKGCSSFKEDRRLAPRGFDVPLGIIRPHVDAQERLVDAGAEVHGCSVVRLHDPDGRGGNPFGEDIPRADKVEF